MKPPVGGPFPARDHCPTPRPRPSAQSAGFPRSRPLAGWSGGRNCRVLGLGGGRSRLGPGLFRTRPSLLRARAPCGGPVPPPTGDHRAGPRRGHPRDRQDRDLRCTGAAHVPESLIKAVVGGVRERHHNQSRGHLAETGSSTTGLGQVGNGCPNDHDIHGLCPTGPPSARRSSPATGALRVRPGCGWGRRCRAGNGAPTATRPRRQGHGEERRQAAPAPGRGRCSRPPCPATPPVSGHAPPRRGASPQKGCAGGEGVRGRAVRYTTRQNAARHRPRSFRPMDRRPDMLQDHRP
jgi:hypothetical protein